MYKIIALIGEAGCGKDTIKKEILKAADDRVRGIVSYTTRPPREGEVEGKDYNFISVEKFTQMVLSFDMIEATEFNGWFYGSAYDSLDKEKPNVGVYNPMGIEGLLCRPEIEVKVYRILTSPKTRLLRQLNREENPDIPEMLRRYEADEYDFSDLDFEYEDLINEKEEDLPKIVKKILDDLGQKSEK